MINSARGDVPDPVDRPRGRGQAQAQRRRDLPPPRLPRLPLLHRLRDDRPGLVRPDPERRRRHLGLHGLRALLPRRPGQPDLRAERERSAPRSSSPRPTSWPARCTPTTSCCLRLPGLRAQHRRPHRGLGAAAGLARLGQLQRATPRPSSAPGRRARRSSRCRPRAARCKQHRRSRLPLHRDRTDDRAQRQTP